MDLEHWLDEIIPKHERLTESVVSITKNLLEDNGIEFLSVTGRTKQTESIHDKIKRKNYKNPPKDMTDMSGIRIILFIESDIKKASDLLSFSFNVDWQNSSNKDKTLLSNQVGYRSVHYVCDLGSERAKLPEYRGLGGLKFEFQIRTVLQHAWAELAHDRSYKFRGALPDDLQRSLYLHAGLLEIADKGFSEIAKNIDSYAEEVNKSYQDGNLDVPINSISLTEFIENWARKNQFPLEPHQHLDIMNDLIKELSAFGITTVRQLKDIIPEDYVKVTKELGIETNIYGLVRDWMVIRDVEKIMGTGVRWSLYDPETHAAEVEVYERLSSPENFQLILEHVGEADDEEITFSGWDDP
ncbi:ppGpp synthetase/RelA/SpoT-type nucleotidyltransferase [Rhizobium skierniewicense]|uniref:PpGpp synthetase/RelA/SpoT-type nucleotidyltransferase n=1 Tax=Rhizobium skierniewicense TaxID=984260 RepID=A0A7W6G591_9HYPH|nr:GTP pyrophosphokinase [Rhizobium skierniewicense]MBB3948306.1 ppGpp synthetase/RelA/SpoT-type nucleotidyltransferase [Rhizobium skierniewicense]